MTVSRRAFLGGLLATAACAGGGDRGSSDTTAAPATTTATAAGGTGPSAVDQPPDLDVELPSDPFTLGVASGDPAATSVVLWTRLAPEPLADGGGMPAPVTSILVEVATDDTFATLVSATRVPVDRERGHSVHAVVDGLEPATGYSYRFRIGTFTSPVGRTRTAPADDDPAPVRLALASCQRFGDGHYVAHRDMAATDLDAVVWVGDYIYERDDELVRRLPDGAPDEASDLDGYRARYATARLDPDLAANHAAHPWVMTWDDHEVRNNYSGGAVGTGDVDVDRVAAAYQAWWEHAPVRFGPPDGPALEVHRSVRLGANVELLVLDTRQHRSAPVCGGGVIDADCDDLADVGRTVLGAEQEAWLVDAAAASVARWTAVAQSVVVTPVEVLGQVNADAWDGYPAARERLLQALAPVRNPVVLTGDVHVQLVGDVPGTAGEVVATELVTASVTSIPAPAYEEAIGLLPTFAPTLRHAVNRRGWVRCEVDADTWTATFREVDDVADPDSAVADGARFRIVDGVPGAAAG